MSKVRSDNITNRADDGAPALVYGAEVPVGYGITGAGGINITGVATAASFSGNLTGNATGLTGTPDITVRNIIGVGATLSGVLTYEDVTNIDSVGIITARSDVSIADKIIHTGDTNTAIRFPAADTFTVETGGSERVRVTSAGRLTLSNSEGIKLSALNSSLYAENGSLSYYGTTNGVYLSGAGTGGWLRLQAAGAENNQDAINIYGGSNIGTRIEMRTNNIERIGITSTGAAIFKGGLAEKYENAGTTLGAQTNQPLSDGNVILFTGNESGNKTINFTGVHSVLSSGESVSFTAIITPNNSGYIGTVQVDGQAITPQWSGGSAPGSSDAGSSGRDVYTFTIFKTGTGTSDYIILGALANYA